jgi:hypothetical protein
MSFLDDVNVFTAEYRRKTDNITRGTWYPKLAIITINDTGYNVEFKKRTWVEDDVIYEKDILQLSNSWMPSPCILMTRQLVKADIKIKFFYFRVKDYTGEKVSIPEDERADKLVWKTKEITLRAGTPEFHMELIDVGITEISTIQVNGGYSGELFDIYALADTNTRITYAINNNETIETIHDIFKSAFAQPVVCPRCDGFGTIDDAVCNLCNGRGSLRKATAKKYGLTLLGASYGRQRFDDESLSIYDTYEESLEKDFRFSRRVHAKKWWITPRIPDLREFAAYWMDLNEEYVRVDEYGFSIDGVSFTEDYINIYVGERLRDLTIASLNYDYQLYYDQHLYTNHITFQMADSIHGKQVLAEEIGREINDIENDPRGEGYSIQIDDYWSEDRVEPNAPYGDGADNTELADAKYSTKFPPYCIQLCGILLEEASVTSKYGIDFRNCGKIEFDINALMFGYSIDPTDATKHIPRLEVDIDGTTVKTFDKNAINTLDHLTIYRSDITSVLNINDLSTAKITFRLVSGYFYDNVFINNVIVRGYTGGSATTAFIDTSDIEGVYGVICVEALGDVYIQYRFGDSYAEIEAASWSDLYEPPKSVEIGGDFTQIRAYVMVQSNLEASYIASIALYATYTSQKSCMYSPHYALSMPFFQGENYWWNRLNAREWWEWIKDKNAAGIVPQLELYLPANDDPTKLDYNEYVQESLYCTETYFLDVEEE